MLSNQTRSVEGERIKGKEIVSFMFHKKITKVPIPFSSLCGWGNTAYLSLVVVVALLGLIGSMRDGADSSLFWRGEILKQDLIFDLL